VGRARRSALGFARELVEREAGLVALMRERRPDVVAGVGGTFVAHAAWPLGIRRVVFTDTEAARLANRMTFPFASVICTPRSYPDRLGPRHVRYDGYKELAYLHPRDFTPDPSALTEAGLAPGEPFVFLRLIAWNAGHDLFQGGLTDVRAAVQRLQRRMRVVVSAEGPRPDGLEPLRYQGPLERVHHVLAFARLSFGESATMGAEAAVLGVPSVVVSTSRRAYLDELETRYELVRTFADEARQERALAEADALLADPGALERWRERRERMLAEQEDVVRFATQVVLGSRNGS
jgi:hypothetical protein